MRIMSSQNCGRFLSLPLLHTPCLALAAHLRFALQLVRSSIWCDNKMEGEAVPSRKCKGLCIKSGRDGYYLPQNKISCSAVAGLQRVWRCEEGYLRKRAVERRPCRPVNLNSPAVHVKHIAMAMVLAAFLALPTAPALLAAQDYDGGLFYVFNNLQPSATIVISRVDTLPAANRLCDHTMVDIPEDVPTDLLKAVELFRRDLRVGYGVDIPLIVVESIEKAAGELPEGNRIEIVVERRSIKDEDRTQVAFPSAEVMRITGGESGVIRTLFRLLEEHAGARFLFQGPDTDIGIGAHFPELKTFGVPRRPVEYNPAFAMSRDSGQTTYLAMIPGNRNRLYWWNWEVRLGAKSRVAHSHFLTKIAFPIDRYITEGPPDEEIFPIKNDERVRPWEWDTDLNDSYVRRQYRQGWQPRYSSPAAVEEAASNLLDYLNRNPGVRSLTLSVNDNGGHCETEIDPAYPTEDNPAVTAAYYGWVNAVVELIVAKHPDIVFGVYGYREVQRPPPFKIHPNVIVYLTFDTQACIDPEVRTRREKLIRDWAELARIGAYFYEYGDSYYSLPRMALEEMRHVVRYYHENGAEAAIIERAYNTATEGPKIYLLYKLLENPQLDMQAAIQDWCEAAVGKEAAPSLMAYYDFWEMFWHQKAVRTAWWGSRNAVYLSLGHFGNYIYALEAGDMAKCRSLMEETLALATQHGTQDQKERAHLLMTGFEWYEANALACGAELLDENGALPDKTAAVKLLRSIPAAEKAFQKTLSIPHETSAWAVPGMTVGRHNRSPLPGLLASAGSFIAEPSVVDELGRLAANPELGTELRFLADAMRMAEGEDGGRLNLLPNGNFENKEGVTGSGVSDDYRFRGTEGWETWASVHGRVAHDDTVAVRGSRSLRCEILHENFRILRILKDLKPNTQYYFSAWAYVPEEQVVQEGRLQIMGSPVSQQDNGAFINLGLTANIQDIVLVPGHWSYVSCVIPGHVKADSIRLRIDLRNFEHGNRVFLDDIKVLEIVSNAESDD